MRENNVINCEYIVYIVCYFGCWMERNYTKICLYNLTGLIISWIATRAACIKKPINS